jgi:hypothetical protein
LPWTLTDQPLTQTFLQSLPVFPVVGGEVLDSVGDVVVVDEALRSGFRLVDRNPPANGALVAGRPVPGHTGVGLELKTTGQEVVSGSTSRPVLGAVLWAKAPFAAAGAGIHSNLYVGVAGALKTVDLFDDGLWHEYMVSFGLSAAAGSTVQLNVTSSSASLPSVVVDDFVLVARPLPSIAVSSSNGFVSPSPLTVTISGLWGVASNLVTVARAVYPCSVCGTFTLPANGAYSFVADLGAYTFYLSGAGGGGGQPISSSPTFAVSLPATTTTTTTTSTTLPSTTVPSTTTTTATTTVPVFPATPADVYDGLKLVVLDDALRSGFYVRNLLPSPIDAKAAEGHIGTALALDAGYSQMIAGNSRHYSSTIQFWAKSPSGRMSLTAMSGSFDLGSISIAGDSVWREYFLTFNQPVTPGQTLNIFGSYTGTFPSNGPPVVYLDDMGLITAPPPVTTIPATTVTSATAAPTTAPPVPYIDWQVRLALNDGGGGIPLYFWSTTIGSVPFQLFDGTNDPVQGREQLLAAGAILTSGSNFSVPAVYSHYVGGTGGGGADPTTPSSTNPPTTAPPTTIAPDGGLPISGEVLTTLKNADGSCMTIRGDRTVGLSFDCDEFWFPRVVPGGYLFESLADATLCLTNFAGQLIVSTCSVSSPLIIQIFTKGIFGSTNYSTLVWADSLNTPTPKCITAGQSIFLDSCDTRPSQQWTDPPLAALERNGYSTDASESSGVYQTPQNWPKKARLPWWYTQAWRAGRSLAGGRPSSFLYEDYLIYQYGAVIDSEASRYGLDRTLLRAVIAQEGGYKVTGVASLANSLGRATYGIGSMNPATALILANRFDNQIFTEDQMKAKLTTDDIYAIHLAAANLRALIDDFGLNNNPDQVRFKAFIAYSLSSRSILDLNAQNWAAGPGASKVLEERAQYWIYWTRVFRSETRR